MSESAVYDDITVSGNADQGDTAPSAPPAVLAGTVETVVEGEPEVAESEATQAAKTLAAQRKKADPAKDPTAKKQSIQAQIDAETYRKHEAKKEADAEAARLEQLRQERARMEQEPAPKSAAADPSKPKREAFIALIGTTYASYEEANDAYDDARDEWREQTTATRAREQAAQTFQQETAAKAQARIDAFKAEHPDYDAVVGQAYIPQGSPSAAAVIEHLRHSDLGPQLAYHLANDLPELARIAALPYGFAIAALGRLEAKLDTPRPEAAPTGPAPPAPDYRPAKPPIKPVGSSPVTSDDDGDPDDLSEAAVNAHVRRENAKESKRRPR